MAVVSQPERLESFASKLKVAREKEEVEVEAQQAVLVLATQS